MLGYCKRGRKNSGFTEVRERGELWTLWSFRPGFVVGVPRWWPVLLTVVGDDLHRLLHWPLVLTFPLRKSSGRDNAQHCYHQQLSHQLNHLQPFLLCQYLLRMEGERVALSWRQQERCHVLLGEECSSYRAFSHRFEFCRTVSYSGDEFLSTDYTDYTDTKSA